MPFMDIYFRLGIHFLEFLEIQFPAKEQPQIFYSFLVKLEVLNHSSHLPTCARAHTQPKKKEKERKKKRTKEANTIKFIEKENTGHN